MPETKVPIGYVGFWKVTPERQHSNLSYLLLPTFWAQGIMTEALRAVLAYRFDKMKLRRVEALVEPGNVPSIQVLEKNGYARGAPARLNDTGPGRLVYARHSIAA